jgi:hypothetical protein
MKLIHSLIFDLWDKLPPKHIQQQAIDMEFITFQEAKNPACSNCFPGKNIMMLQLMENGLKNWKRVIVKEDSLKQKNMKEYRMPE